MKRHFPSSFNLIALAFLTLGTTLLAGAQPQNQPNFVIINMDDLGCGGIAPFGSKLNRTPNLDRMAKAGRMLT